MKDFYDLWSISEAFDFEGRALVRAIGATFERRGTPMPADVPPGLRETLMTSSEKQAQWRAFVARGRLGATPAPFPEIVAAVREFVMPPAGAARAGQDFDSIWRSGGSWQHRKM